MRRNGLRTFIAVILALTLSCNRSDQQSDRRIDLQAPASLIAMEDREQDHDPYQSGDWKAVLEEDLLLVLEKVPDAVDASTHVRASVYRDRELGYISEEQVPGIGRFRDEIEKMLDGRQVNTLLHHEVFTMLDENSSLFRTPGHQNPLHYSLHFGVPAAGLCLLGREPGKRAEEADGESIEVPDNRFRYCSI